MFTSGRRAEMDQSLDSESLKLGKLLRLCKSQFLVYKMGMRMSANGIV
jgi:hypothetical protein